MLCKVCKQLFESHIGDGNPRPHQETVSSLETAAEEGCYICSNVYRQFIKRSRPGEDYHTLQTPLFNRQYTQDSGQGLVGLEIEISSSNRTIVMAGCKFVLWPLSKSPELVLSEIDMEKSGYGRLHHRSYSNIPRSTSDPDVAQLARSWLSKCKTTHKACGSLSTFRPARLLDVSYERPRLVLKRNYPKNIEPYAALSHCWGPRPTFTTLTKTVLNRFIDHGISDKEMPPNFRDAVHICRSLHIRYLWIDSLCIFQSGEGSAEDWLEHVDSMREIYNHCEVCISAANAASAEQTCFSERTTDDVLPFAVHVGPPRSLETSPQPHVLIPSNLHTEGHRSVSLASRGWVLQERILSPRILTLGPKQLFWECADSCARNVCETFPDGLPFDIYPKVPFGFPKSSAINLEDSHKQRLNFLMSPTDTSAGAETESADPTLESPAKFWRDLVEQYSNCTLSYPDADKFPAFAGLARHAATLLSDKTYIAGFFQHELPQSLLWRIRRDDMPRHRPQYNRYRAPSWSWAATDVGIELYETFIREARFANGGYAPTEICLSPLKDFTVRLVDENNAFGPIEYAELVLSAQLYKFNWDATGAVDSPSVQIKNLVEQRITPWFFFDSEEDFYQAQEDVFFLPIVEHEGWCYDGLVVRMVQDTDSRNSYSRIGKGRVYGVWDFKSKVEGLERLREVVLI